MAARTAMTIGLARRQSDSPMGQELADAALLAGLREKTTDLDVIDISIAGRRDAVQASRRIPLGRVAASPWPVQLAVGRLAYRGVDLVHRLDLKLPPSPGPEVLTVRDLAPLRFSDEGNFPKHAARAISRAAAVICPSEFSAGELRSMFEPATVDVIPDALDPVFLKGRSLTPREREALGLPQRWVLHSGGASTRKNLRLLAQAWPIVHRTHPEVGLVLCGPTDPRRTSQFDGMPNVHLMGKVSRSQLVDLVASSAVVVVPSRYEGYGLPAQEAMASGVPVVAVAAGSLPEVLGPYGSLVEDDPDALADGLRHALDGLSADKLADGMAVARGRTIELMAEAHRDVYRRVAHEIGLRA
jgi:glycosyltransferase involved in cell wall biosynthesis